MYNLKFHTTVQSTALFRLIGALAGMFLPGASILVSAAISFAVVYIAGQIFLQLILKLAKKSSNPYSFSDISASQMKDMVGDIKVSKDDLNAAKEAYKKNQ